MTHVKIAVIGAGRIGGTLGAAWESAGHEVVYGLRDPGKRQGAAAFESALDGADAVLLAIPGNAVAAFVRDHAEHVDGKVVIDATNNFGGPSFNSWTEMSKVAPHAHLYRAFNSYGWDVYANPNLGGEQPDLFYAGPDGKPRETVEQLITDSGLRPVWVGGPEACDVIDGVLRLWFTLAQKRGRRIAFKLIAD